MSETQRLVNEALEWAATAAEAHAAECVDPGTGCPFAIAATIRKMKSTR